HWAVGAERAAGAGGCDRSGRRRWRSYRILRARQQLVDVRYAMGSAGRAFERKQQLWNRGYAQLEYFLYGKEPCRAAKRFAWRLEVANVQSGGEQRDRVGTYVHHYGRPDVLRFCRNPSAQCRRHL